VTFALAALALTFGTLFPQFETENTAQIPTSVGGLLFMMTAVALLAAVLVLESWPVLTIFRHRLSGGSPEGSVWLMAGASGLAAVAICVAATVLPLRVALRRIESLEA